MSTKKQTFLETYLSARACSVPIVAVNTADQNATVELLAAQSLDDDGKAPAAVQWDAARGLSGVNKAGSDLVKSSGVNPDETLDFAIALEVFGGRLTARGVVLFVHNAHRQLTSSEPMSTARAVQATANLRDVLKRNHRMLVLLAPTFVAPPELTQDIIALTHDLPDAEALGEIVKQLYSSCEPPLPAPSKDELEKATAAAIGLSAFAAEQQAAMSLRPTGMDADALWERKRVTIQQTRGLSASRGGQRFSDLVGMDNAKARLRQIANGKLRIGVAVLVDEADKVFANTEHDTTGVRTDQVRTFATEMEDNGYTGMIFEGVPGGGKTALARAFANEIGVPLITMDVPGMEDSLVGNSQMYLRQAFAIIKAMGGARAFFIATSNNAAPLRPEMIRRFCDGTFFFDLMSAEQRVDAFGYYLQQYGLDASQPLPDHDGWTGAEIRNCVRSAWNSGISLADAAQFIVPVARIRATEIDAMRQHAHGRYLDANQPGTFNYTGEVMKQFLRAVKLDTRKEQVN